MKREDIDISSSDLALIIQILQKYVPGIPVWAFGSRIKGTARKFSDLDLVIKTTEPLPLKTLGDLAEAFSESELSIKIDVIDWSRISEDFQKVILGKYVVLL